MDEGKYECIEKLIDVWGWNEVQNVLISILMDNGRRAMDWYVITQVFWGAVLDQRTIDKNTVIALLYHRVPNDNGSDENNLVWSITSKLKGVGYLSEYNPMNDPIIIAEKKRLGIT